MPDVPRPLVRAEALSAWLEGPDAPVVLDVRWALGGSEPDAYAEQHLPGALFCDLEEQLSDRSIPAETAGRHPLPSAEAFTAAMRSLGVRADRPVVVYDAKDSIAAARAWWCLTYFGHPDVRVLDGGLASWVGAGLPVERGAMPVDELRSERADREPGSFTAVPGHLPTVDIERVSAGEGFVLVDVRAAERYRGEVEPVDPVAGRIPGSINSPTLDLVESDGRFLHPDALRARFEAAGVMDGSDQPVVAYCGSGVNASHTVLAMHLIGVTAALFPGSYSQWCRDRGRPIATG